MCLGIEEKEYSPDYVFLQETIWKIYNSVIHTHTHTHTLAHFNVHPIKNPSNLQSSEWAKLLKYNKLSNCR